MPAAARQFRPYIVRSGGVVSKYKFSTRCSKCSRVENYETVQSVSDTEVRDNFVERGWLLGRDQSHDLCPACLARPGDTPQKRSQVHPRAHGNSPDQRRRDTADILARHLGKPEALAAEVFRPKETTPAKVPTILPGQNSELKVNADDALAEIRGDLKGLREATEKIAEQLGLLVASSTQQIEVIAQFAPALIQVVDSLNGKLQPRFEALTPNQSQSGCEAPQELQPDVETSQRAGQTSQRIARVELPRHSPTQGPRKRPARHARQERVVVKSIADPKREDRFYTSIRMPRTLWDRAGFAPDDRILLDWSGQSLTITRTREGGVKPKALGDTSVVLQSWKLGNINIDQANVTTATDSLRLEA